MTHATTETDFGKETDTWSVLEQTLREGARRMLQQALELEVAEYLEKHSGQRDENGKRMVVKNGYHPERDLVTGVGPIGVRHPVLMIESWILKGLILLTVLSCPGT